MTSSTTPFRRTKLVCTLGPATDSEERIAALIQAGMNVARLNFSHGTHEEHAARVRRAAAALGAPVAILQDLQGPRIRTGAFAGGEVYLEPGSTVTITTEQVTGSRDLIPTTYARLPLDVRPGDRILFADGRIEVAVEQSNASTVRALVIHGGRVGEHHGINLPGIAVSSPSLSDKDRDDLRFGLSLGVD